jgi:hypothetical protein
MRFKPRNKPRNALSFLHQRISRVRSVWRPSKHVPSRRSRDSSRAANY